MAHGSLKDQGSNRVWLSQYEAGIEPDVSIKEKSLVDIFEDSFNRFRSLPAFSCMGIGLSFDRVDRYSRELAAYFQKKLGLARGTRIAIMMPNVLQYPVAMFGILRGGFTVVNVNPLYTARELQHQLSDSGAEAIVIMANFAHTLGEVIGQTKVKHVIVTEIGDLLGFPKSLVVNLVVKHIKKLVPQYFLPQAVSFNAALAEGSNLTYDRPEIDLQDLAFLQYTGGTTGVSKGAMLTHSNMVHNVYQTRAWISSRVETDGQPTIVTPLPLYHIFSLLANCIVFFSMGGLNILITNPKDMPGFIRELSKWRFTALTGVNTLFVGLMNQPGFKELDFSSFKMALGGGAAVQKAVAERWKELTGKPLIQAYGLTETSPAACINPFNIEEFNGTIGVPLPSTYVSLRDDDGNEVPTGQSGEIWIKGPQVMKGYWQREKETSEVLTPDGWLKTGDIGVFDAKGFVTIVDRKKDMILVSGFNVYPNEIEEVVVSHPGVLEAAAIGVPDEKTGEAIKVFVVKRDPNLTVEELSEHCRKNLTGYKVPRRFEFKDDLPKTNVGKILRRALRG